MKRAIPTTASVVQPDEGEKLHAPAAARNADALCSLITQHAPTQGTALEIASGTGQHITAFARALPHLRWQPSDIEAPRLRSIDAHSHDANLSNIAPAIHLDAVKTGWSVSTPSQDLIVLINLLHLISEDEVKTVFAEVAKTLTPDGTFIFYGPFKRDGALTSDGDVTFDAQLRAADPLIGYKDTLDIQRWLADVGLNRAMPFEMPANNIAFVARKPRL